MFVLPFIMTSFYLTLTSDDGVGEQPGDFTCELSDVLNFSEGWEMALVELTYTGQEFDTIPTEHGLITITSKEKLKYDANYVVFWHETWDLHIDIQHVMNATGKVFKKEVIRLPQQHYSWTFFKYALAEGFRMYSELVTCSFVENDTILRIKVPYYNNVKYINITLSEEMTRLLSAEKSSNFWSTYADTKVTMYDIKIKKPEPRRDGTQTVIVPSCKNSDLGISIGDDRFVTLPKQFWTIEMLRLMFERFSRKYLEGTIYNNLQLLYTAPELASDTFYLITETKTLRNESRWKAPAVPWFSPAFNMTLINRKRHANMPHGAGAFNWVVTDTYKFALCDRILDPRYKSFTLKRQLNNTHYPNLTSLVSHLNNVCLDIFNEIASTLNIATPEEGPFTCKNNIVTFTQYKHFDVKCSPFLAKMLHLTLSAEGNLITQQGTQAVELSKYKRSHLYVHCDCVRSHYVNSGTTSLIRTVPNSAIVGQKHTVTYPDCHYYPLIRTHIAYINMYITDDIVKGILRLANKIVYTLHFRKCLN